MNFLYRSEERKIKIPLWDKLFLLIKVVNTVIFLTPVEG